MKYLWLRYDVLRKVQSLSTTGINQCLWFRYHALRKEIDNKRDVPS